MLADSLTAADIDATAAYALGLPGPPSGWGAGRDGAGLVVWSDGTTTVVREAAGLLPAAG